MSDEPSPKLPRATLTSELELATSTAPDACAVGCSGPREPRIVDHATHAGEAAPGENVRPRVVLLVEDDVLIRMDAAEMLVDAGHEVVDAEYGPDALAVLEARHVDVLVTDVGLPGMSGLELAERACRLQPGIGVVFATGDTELSQTKKAQGTAVFLCKPYDSASLARSVRRAFDCRRT